MTRKLFKDLKVGDVLHGFQHNNFATSQVEKFVITKMENVNIEIHGRVQNIWVFEFEGHNHSYRINNLEMNDYFVNYIDKYGIELYLSTESMEEVIKYRDWYDSLLVEAQLNY